MIEADKTGQVVPFAAAGWRSWENEEEPGEEVAERVPEFTDEALALTFAGLHEPDLRYVADWGRWLEWRDGRWRFENTLLAFSYARQVCRESAERAVQVIGGKPAERIAAGVASASTVAAVERLAKADRRLAATVDQWDSDPDLLNTPSGVVHLVADGVHPHRREYFCTKMTATGPAPEGTPCPLWLAFLNRVTNGDAELIRYLQVVAGYMLTGSTKEYALFFAYGTGRNGKGVFINTLTSIMGDYATVASMETFTASRHPQHPTDLAALRGARLVTAQETEQGRHWAESRIKALTGGDPITARFMAKDFFTYTPTFKLFIAGNHKPGLRSVDEAIRARFHLVPFTVTIPAEERDPDLPEKLKADWPAILRWMIYGCMMWRAEGLRKPAAVQSATDEYLAMEDAFALWLEDASSPSTMGFETTADLFASWKLWAERAGETVGSQKQFSQTLEARGFARKPQAGTGKAGFTGLTLHRPDYTDDPRFGS
jgi:putative DNA primase/helicase